MQISKNGMKLIEMFENREYEAYLDSGGELTVGVGHLLTKGEKYSGKIVAEDSNGELYYVRYDRRLNDTEVDNILRYDLSIAEDVINSKVKVKLTQYQYDALVSFVFNVGVQAFKDSTLLKVLNNKDYDGVPIQMRRWIRDNGLIIGGLITRRNNEIKVWENRMEIEFLHSLYEN